MGRNLKRVPVQRSLQLEDAEVRQLVELSTQIEQLQLVQLGVLYRLEKKYGVNIPGDMGLDANSKSLVWMEDSNITEFPSKETEGEDTENNGTDSSD